MGLTDTLGAPGGLQPCALCLGPTPTGPVCDGCRRDLPWNRHACPRCAEPRSVDAAACGQCLQHPPAFDAAWAPLIYGPPVDRLITRLKFHDALGTAGLLGSLLADAAPAHLRPDRCLPIPLHPDRLRRRGYNQAALIAAAVARRRGWTLDARTARRTRNTTSQADLSAAARRTNMRDAFAVTRRLTDEHVVLIDDVITTGATASALARACKRAGARRVTVLAATRTP